MVVAYIPLLSNKLMSLRAAALHEGRLKQIHTLTNEW